MTEVAHVDQIGVWMPLFHDYIWHVFIMVDGHLKTLCGIWKGPGGTSTEHRRRKKCPECERRLRGDDQ